MEVTWVRCISAQYDCCLLKRRILEPRCFPGVCHMMNAESWVIHLQAMECQRLPENHQMLRERYEHIIPNSSQRNNFITVLVNIPSLQHVIAVKYTGCL